MSKTLKERFDDVDSEYLKFDRIPYPPSKRSDLSAFMLLDGLVPGTSDIISCSEHDEIFLETDVARLNEVATDDDIIALRRCGVCYNSTYDCLYMFT